MKHSIATPWSVIVGAEDRNADGDHARVCVCVVVRGQVFGRGGGISAYSERNMLEGRGG
jgi:hypothetical protein